mmetsp:Transcript_48840/g.119012  ORF Transcript_48840/g.119012 Transcript_48840/m.119012 type:complete len:200 (+) Transcript_48840:1000-1599(+)
MHRSSPSTKIPSRSHSPSASSMLCVVRKIARDFFASLITAHSVRREAGSSPVDGSSRYAHSGCPIIEMATLRRRFIPPEKAPARWCALSVRRTSSMRRSASVESEAKEMPLIAPKSSRCCLAERLSQRMSNCGHTPIIFLTRAIPAAVAILCPSTSALPLVGGRKPVSILIVVDFPAPLGPSRAKSWRLPMLYHGHLTA